MFEDETFVADAITTQQPTVPSAPFDQINVMSANAITTGAPDVGEPTFVNVYNLFTGELVTGAPIIPQLVYDAALGRIATEAESKTVAELFTKNSNKAVIVRTASTG